MTSRLQSACLVLTLNTVRIRHFLRRNGGFLRFVVKKIRVYLYNHRAARRIYTMVARRRLTMIRGLHRRESPPRQSADSDGPSLADDSVDISWAVAAIDRLHAQFAAAPDAAPQSSDSPPEREESPPGPLGVAVVVPVFNGAAHLADCLESVRLQTCHAWRCYVVDDASTDETSGIAESFAAQDDRFVVLRHGRNAGLLAARNTGLAHAEEPLVTFLDADDMLTLSSLQRRASAMRDLWSNQAVAGAWGNLYPVRENASLADSVILDGERRREPTIHAATKDGECPFNVHAPLLRTELARRLGGFDERIQYGAEDWDLWHRFLRHGYVFEHAGRSVGLYRRRRQSMTASGPLKHLDQAFQLLAAAEKTALVDERLTVDPHAAAPLARQRFAQQWLRRLAQYAGLVLAASGDRNAADYRRILERACGAPRAMMDALESHAEAGLKRGFAIGSQDRLPAPAAEQITRIAKAVADDVRTAAARAPQADEEGAATVDCRPLLAEPDVVVVAETTADVHDLVGFVRRLRARGWDAVALDADYARGDQGAARAWQCADVPTVPCNHLRFGRVRPARLLLCRPFGPLTAALTAALAAAVGRAGGAVVEWSGGVAEARLPCNATEATSFDSHWTAEMDVPEKSAGAALEPVAPGTDPPESPDGCSRPDDGRRTDRP